MNSHNNRYFLRHLLTFWAKTNRVMKRKCRRERGRQAKTTVKNILPINNKFLFYFFSIFNLEMKRSIHFILLFIRYGLLRLVFVNPSCGTHNISCCFLFCYLSSLSQRLFMKNFSICFRSMEKNHATFSGNFTYLISD